jgi:hypothetical protein
MLERIRKLFVCGATAAWSLAGCGSSELDSSFQPPARCSLPFVGGPCEAAIQVYAFVDGSCEERIYGGCEGNENRFNSLEECLATCEGRPEHNGCPPGRVHASICVGCGPAGGCGETLEACAQPCTENSMCTATGFGCWDGVCQATYCE